MKDILQKDIAMWLKVGESTLSRLKKGKCYFHHDSIRSLANITGLPYRLLAEQKGEHLYRAIMAAYEPAMNSDDTPHSLKDKPKHFKAVVVVNLSIEQRSHIVFQKT